jgi:hypothetical protein
MNNQEMEKALIETMELVSKLAKETAILMEASVVALPGPEVALVRERATKIRQSSDSILVLLKPT